MTVQLNKQALAHARSLIRNGSVVHDERDDWSKHAPSTAESNDFIQKHGMDEYATWHLGEDTGEKPENKGRYLFPYGDFSKIHRCAVISGESRAGQYKHGSIEDALKQLLKLIDKND
jgi:hypothetical protein